jgi:hypothetical protein
MKEKLSPKEAFKNMRKNERKFQKAEMKRIKERIKYLKKHPEEDKFSFYYNGEKIKEAAYLKLILEEIKGE